MTATIQQRTDATIALARQSETLFGMQIGATLSWAAVEGTLDKDLVAYLKSKLIPQMTILPIDGWQEPAPPPGQEPPKTG